jgi:hypothetical protein
MIIQVTHPETKEVIDIEIDSMNIEELQELYKPKTPEKTLLSAIENLSLPAEAKALLFKIKDFSIQVGGVALEIGKKILELIIYFIKKYPSTTIGLIVGSVLGMLFSSIPILGWALGWLLMPLCIALGLALGFWKDFTNKDLNVAIDSAIAEFFSSFKNVAAPEKA